MATVTISGTTRVAPSFRLALAALTLFEILRADSVLKWLLRRFQIKSTERPLTATLLWRPWLPDDDDAVFEVA